MEALPSFARERIRTNRERVLERIARAAEAAGRAPGDIRLVAVTKSVGPEWIRALVALGHQDLGENRPEEVPLKAAALGAAGAGVRWHMIGHYQSRKVRGTLPYFTLVHSVHSRDLLDRLQAAAPAGRRIGVLLQVNVSGEGSKQGFAPAEVLAVLDSAERWPSLDVRGFMTMAPADAPSDRARAVFAGLRRLRDRSSRPGLALPELSMGMSSDFEAAVIEGSTLVRVGSALFEGAVPAGGEVGGRPEPT